MLADQIRLFGNDHGDAVYNRISLASALARADRVDDAIEQIREGIETSGRVLGPEDPQTLRFRHHLGSLLVETNRGAQAVEPLEALLTQANTAKRCRILRCCFRSSIGRSFS